MRTGGTSYIVIRWPHSGYAVNAHALPTEVCRQLIGSMSPEGD